MAEEIAEDKFHIAPAFETKLLPDFGTSGHKKNYRSSVKFGCGRY